MLGRIPANLRPFLESFDLGCSTPVAEAGRRAASAGAHRIADLDQYSPKPGAGGPRAAGHGDAGGDGDADGAAERGGGAGVAAAGHADGDAGADVLRADAGAVRDPAPGDR